MNIIIRRATTADAKYIALIGRISFADTFRAIFESQDNLMQYLDQTYQVEKIKNSIAHEAKNLYWLALKDDLPIGFMKIKKENSDSWQLQKIYLLHHFLGLKIGQKILQIAHNELIANNIKSLWLMVEDRNERAISFYEKIGFDKKTKEIFTIGEQTFHFEKMEYDKY
jgi:diamine N-acetyltransferase